MSRVLLVAPFAPYRDGIAVYAQQEFRRLLDEGHEVSVCSPVPSAAEFHHGIGAPKGLANLVRTARGFDRVILQFYPELLFGGCRTAAQRVTQWGLLASLGRIKDVEIRIHEVDYEALRSNAAERRAAKLAMRAASSISMHTEEERQQLVDALDLDPASVSLVDHGRDFVRRYRGTKAEARAELNIPLGEHLFLAIGFLQAHKGFDRALDAFAQLSPAAASLHIVGSARVDHPDVVAYVGRLRRMAANTGGVTLHSEFVGDIEFDRWLAAADTLVLPYREIWSSGVVERAKLYDLFVIASNVGGLSGQVGGASILIDDDASLRSAMASRLDSASSGQAVQPVKDKSSRWIVDAGSPDQRSIQQQIRGRAGPSAVTTSNEPLWLPLDELGEPLSRPLPTSARPGVAPIKRLVQALTWWQIQPILERVQRLEQATLLVAKRADAAIVARDDVKQVEE